jgi:hypothetical protein
MLKPFWMKGPVWAPNDGDGGDGGSQSPDGAGTGVDGGDQSGDGQQAGVPDGSGSAPGSSILDFADKAKDDGTGDSDGWTAPESVPEHLRGDSAEATIEKLAKAYNGRRKDIGKGEGEGAQDVPENVDGYTLEAAGDDDAVAAEFNSEEAKPVVDAFKKAALDNGIGAEAFANFMRGGLQNMVEAGLPIGVSPDEAYEISGEAEMETLVNDLGPKEAGTVVNTVEQYGLKQVERGVISEDEMNEFRIMAGTALGSKVMFKLITGEFGETPIPMPTENDGQVSAGTAYAAHAAAMKMPPGAERDEALAAAQGQMQKAFGTQNRPGAVRSNVL